MTIIEKAKMLCQNGTVRDASLNLFEDALAGVLGDPVSIAKMILAIAGAPFFIREQLFWEKFQAFLNGVSVSDDDKATFAKHLAEGNKRENAVRLINCIERVDGTKKINYFCNAGRALSADFITLEDFFRIIGVVSNTIVEDLEYMRAHISESNICYNISVQGLLSVGMMYQSVFDEGDASGTEIPKYSFTTLAELIDRFAVSYSDVNRYPNPIATVLHGTKPMTADIVLPTLTESEIHDMFEDNL